MLVKHTQLGNVENLIYALAGLGAGLLIFALYMFLQKKSQQQRVGELELLLSQKEQSMLSIQKDKEILQVNNSEAKSLEDSLRKELLTSQTDLARTLCTN